MKKIVFIVLAILFSLAFIILKFGTPNIPTVDKHRMSIVTSFYPLYFFTSELATSDTLVTNITPVGLEPHDYEPTPKELVLIEKSQLLVLNGGGFEPWSDHVSDRNKIVNTAGGLLTEADPHTWLSPRLAKKQAQKILDALVVLDPGNTNNYLKRGQILFSKFDDLDRKYEAGLKQCQRRDFITSHRAFAYLAKTYNLVQISIADLSPEEEPSLKKLASVADFARKNGVKFIFFESLVSPKFAQTIADEVGVKTLVLDPIEGLREADMKLGKNYFTIMEENLSNLRIALSCK